MTLRNAPIDAVVEIRQVQESHPAMVRLMELGLVEGSRVRVLRRAPMGDPIQIRLFEDYDLTLRCSEADLMTVAAVA